MKILLILARLLEYLKLLDNDIYQLKVICQAIEKIEQNIAPLSLLQGQKIPANDPNFQNICSSLGTISSAIKQLSPRRGSLMSRNSKIPWKILMMMDETIRRCQTEAPTTLVASIMEMISNGEIKTLNQAFNSFLSEMLVKNKACTQFCDILKEQLHLLQNVRELKTEQDNYIHLFAQVVTAIQAIGQITKEKVVNEQNLQYRLTDLERLQEQVQSDPFLSAFLHKWQSEIGFNAASIPKEISLISSHEVYLMDQFTYHTITNHKLSQHITNIENVQLESGDKINSFHLRSTLTKIIDKLTTATKMSVINQAKADCFDLYLKCLTFNINSNGIQQLLFNIKHVDLENRESFIEKLKLVHASINPFQEHKSALDNVKQALGGKDGSIANKISSMNTDAKATQDKKIYLLLLSQLKALIRLDQSESQSTLSPYIKELIRLLTESVNINATLEPNAVVETMVVNTKEKLTEQIERIQQLFEMISRETVIEEIQDINEIFNKIQEYITTVIREQKIENDLEADLSFCPTLCRYLQYNFDNKNLNVTLKTLNQMLSLFLENEEAFNNPACKMVFLHTMLVLGESTKDFSAVLQNANQDIPWFLFRMIRNKIFHVLIDELNGRDQFWQFLAGSSDKLNNALLSGCIKEVMQLHELLGQMTLHVQPNISWDLYPNYEIKPISFSPVSQLGNTVRSIMKGALEHELVQEISENEKRQMLRFPNLFLLSDQLTQIDISSRLLHSGNETLTVQAKEILQALQEIEAIENFFHSLNLSETSLSLIQVTPSTVFPLQNWQLAPICSIGTAYCGGLLKLLKDSCTTFESLAPPLVLIDAENIIHLRGELAHAVAVKDSTVELNTLLSVNESTVPFLKISACRLMISQLPPTLKYTDELKTLYGKFKKSECSGAFNELQGAIKSLSEISNFQAKDMKKLIKIYDAIKFYATHNFEDIAIILHDMKKVQNQCAQRYEFLNQELDKIRRARSELEQYTIKFQDERLGVILSELKLIDNAIEAITAELYVQTKVMINAIEEEKIIDEYIREITNKMAKPLAMTEISECINSSFPKEILLIRKIQDTLHSVATQKVDITNLIETIDTTCPLLEKSCLKLMLLLENPADTLAEIKAMKGDFTENKIIFLKNFHIELEKSLQEFTLLKQQYQQLYLTYNRLISIMAELESENNHMKKGKDNNSEIAKCFDSEITQLKGMLVNKLQSIQQNMINLEKYIQAIELRKISLIDLIASGEVQNIKKHNEDDEFGPALTVTPLASSSQLSQCFHTPSRKFSDKHHVASLALDEDTSHQFEIDSFMENFHKHPLKPLVAAKLLDIHLIKYNHLNEQQIKNLSNPDMQDSILFGELKAEFVMKLSDEQVSRISTARGPERYEVIRGVASEVHNPKLVTKSDAQTSTAEETSNNISPVNTQLKK